jgi:hypothetical protein
MKWKKTKNPTKTEGEGEMMSNFILINQSQQNGIETALTQAYSTLLQFVTPTCKYHNTLIPCYRLTNTISTDDELLRTSVNAANCYYNAIMKGAPLNKVCQVDVHVNANNGKSKGFVICHIGKRSAMLASYISDALKDAKYPYEVEIQYRPELWTLKKSTAINVITEFGYYDNQQSMIWHYNNRIMLCKAISQGCCKLLDTL